MNKLKIKFNSVTKLDSLKKKSGIISIINQDSEKSSVCKRLDLFAVLQRGKSFLEKAQ